LPLQDNCISVECIFNWNTSVAGHKYLSDAPF